jgi:mannose-6-phosphate isomerase
VPEDLVGSTTELASGNGDGLTRLPDGGTLRDAIAADPLGYLGAEHVERFGDDLALLVKLLDTSERLLVHVHPDRAFAREYLCSSHGKTEAWIITEADIDPDEPSSGHVYLGFREPIAAELMRRWVDTQDVPAMLGALNKVPVRPGDTCLVPAGVPHGIGAGIMLVEVQEPTDLSILLEWQGFAIDGPADGHLGLGFDTALAAVDRSAWDAERIAALVNGRAGVNERPGVTRLLPPAADPFFRVERVEPSGGAVGFQPQVAVLVVLDGAGELRTDAGVLPLARGTTVFVPHGAGAAQVAGEVTVLRCLPPDPTRPDPVGAL